jgi:hypothetical protein
MRQHERSYQLKGSFVTVYGMAAGVDGAEGLSYNLITIRSKNIESCKQGKIHGIK